MSFCLRNLLLLLALSTAVSAARAAVSGSSKTAEQVFAPVEQIDSAVVAPIWPQQNTIPHASYSALYLFEVAGLVNKNTEPGSTHQSQQADPSSLRTLYSIQFAPAADNAIHHFDVQAPDRLPILIAFAPETQHATIAERSARPQQAPTALAENLIEIAGRVVRMHDREEGIAFDWLEEDAAFYTKQNPEVIANCFLSPVGRIIFTFPPEGRSKLKAQSSALALADLSDAELEKLSEEAVPFATVSGVAFLGLSIAGCSLTIKRRKKLAAAVRSETFTTIIHFNNTKESLLPA